MEEYNRLSNNLENLVFAVSWFEDFSSDSLSGKGFSREGRGGCSG